MFPTLLKCSAIAALVTLVGFIIIQSKIYSTTSGGKSDVNPIPSEARQLSFLEDGTPSNYYSSSAHVYYGKGIISDADPNTFQALSYSPAAGGNDAEWAKDESRVYRFGRPVDGVDAATFETVGMGVMKDKDDVYFLAYIGGSCTANPLCNADPNSLASLGHGYFKDASRAYHLTNWYDSQGGDLFAAQNLDIASLQALDERTLVDEKSTYNLVYDPFTGYSLVEINSKSD